MRVAGVVRMVRSRLTCVLFALASTAGATVACSAEADPEAAPTSSVTTSVPPTTPTTDPTDDPTDDPEGPVEPALPTAARAPTRAGAEAFVRYYIDLLNYAANTGDTEPLRAAAKGCSGCDDYVRLYEKTYEAGGWFRDPGWRPFSLISRRETGRVTVLAQVDAPAVIFVKREGAKPQRGHPATYSLRFDVIRTKARWVMTELVGR